jgi:hypothetical protein
MTRQEAAKIVRDKWAGNDGCRSCGHKRSLAEVEPVEDSLDAAVVAQGFVEFLCSEDDTHRGTRIYLDASRS